MSLIFDDIAIEKAAEAAYNARSRNKPYRLLAVSQREQIKSEVRAALSAALAVEGMALVPVEPTEAMLEAGEDTFFTTYTGTATSTPGDVWQAMLKAAGASDAGK